MAQHILVTGAGSGIGAAIVNEAVESGATVVAVDRSQLEYAPGLTAPALASYRCDISDRSAIDAIVQREGPFDVVVAAAGIVGFATTRSATDGDIFDRIIATNLTGAYNTARSAAAAMAPGGCIVLISSAAWNTGQAYMAAYCASKAGVVALARSMAMEFIHADFSVCCVAPGAVDTRIMDGVTMPPEVDAALVDRYTPLRPVLDPSVVARVTLDVARQGAAFHGGVIPLDSGMTAG